MHTLGVIISHYHLNHTRMLRNYVKIALRAMLKNKVFTTLNVLGLTLGIVAALVIFLYVQDEFTYDQHHANTGRIHRLAVTYHLPKNAGQETWATIAAPVGGYVVQDYPEVEKAVRFRSASNKVVEKPGTNLNLFEKIWYTDSTVFSIFDFPLLQGNPAEALNDPFEMVITQEVARRYFGTEDALGRTLFLPEDSTTFTITGVLRILAAIIAFLGLFSALMALQLERTREFAIYRAIGFLPRQLAGMIVSESTLLGLVAGLLAIPVGCLVCYLLVVVINRRSFGWSMELAFEPALMFQGLLLALLAAVMAGLYPAFRIARSPVAVALRSE